MFWSVVSGDVCLGILVWLGFLVGFFGLFFVLFLFFFPHVLVSTWAKNIR